MPQKTANMYTTAIGPVDDPAERRTIVPPTIINTSARKSSRTKR